MRGRLATATAIVVLLAGCGGEDEEAAGPAVTTAPAAADGPKRLTHGETTRRLESVCARFRAKTLALGRRAVGGSPEEIAPTYARRTPALLRQLRPLVRQMRALPVGPSDRAAVRALARNMQAEIDAYADLPAALTGGGGAAAGGIFREIASVLGERARLGRRYGLPGCAKSG